MNFTEFTALPGIVVVVYLAAYFLKNMCRSERVCRMIPPICGALGMILGLVCFFTLPDCIPAGNWLTAAATGIVSGFAATGVHQTYKQIIGKDANSGKDG